MGCGEPRVAKPIPTLSSWLPGGRTVVRRTATDIGHVSGVVRTAATEGDRGAVSRIPSAIPTAKAGSSPSSAISRSTCVATTNGGSEQTRYA